MRTTPLWPALIMVLALALWGCRGKVTEKTPIYSLPEMDLAYFGPASQGNVPGDTNGTPAALQINCIRQVNANTSGTKYNDNVDSYSEEMSDEVFFSKDGSRISFSCALVQGASAAGISSYLSLSLTLYGDTGRQVVFGREVSWQGKSLAGQKGTRALYPGGPMVDCLVFTSAASFADYNGQYYTNYVKEVVFARNIGFVRAELHAQATYPQAIDRTITVQRTLH